VKQFVCPLPNVWAALHGRLHKAWRKGPDTAAPRPPLPLILGGWAYSSDAEKQECWVETVRWAERYGFSRLIPALREEETYWVPVLEPGANQGRRQGE
jgi:hypothetical protein